MNHKVIFNGQILILTRFWATGEPCLWISEIYFLVNIIVQPPSLNKLPHNSILLKTLVI